jgi:hypothetical protein
MDGYPRRGATGVPTQRPRSRRAPRVVVALAATLALVGPTACNPTQPSASPTGSAPPTAVAGSFARIAWRDVAAPAGIDVGKLGEIRITSAIGGPAGAMTVLGQGEPVSQVRVLRHRGTAWIAEPTSGLTSTTGLPVWPDRIAALPDRYLAFVQGYDPSTGETFADLVFQSTDGASWRPVGGPSDVNGIWATAASAKGVVACGGAMGDGSGCAFADTSRAITWQPVAIVPPGWDLMRLAAGPGGFVAVAWDETFRLRTIVSQDGATWAVAPPDPAIAPNGGMPELVAFGGRFVLATTVPGDRRDPRTSAAALFASIDGRTWHRLAVPATDSGQFELIQAGPALLAVGSRPSGFDDAWTGVLVSLDGLTWRLDPDPSPLANVGGVTFANARDAALAFTVTGEEHGLLEAVPEPVDDAGMPVEPPPTPAASAASAASTPALVPFELVGSFAGSVSAAAYGDGVFVALGNWATEAGPDRPTTWTSVDGRSWRMGQAIAGPQDEVTAVASWHGLFFAGGSVAAASGEAYPTRTAAFWSSEDGVAWAQAPASPSHVLGQDTLDGPVPAVRALVATGAGLVAIASTPSGGAVFRSTDGGAWTRVAELDGSPTAATVHQGRLVVVGNDSPGYPAFGRALAWSSTDAVTWQRVGLDSAPLSAVASNGSVVVADGEGPVAWVSADGIAWAWAPDQAALTWGRMTSLAAASAEVLGVGTDRCADRPTCLSHWVSADGLAWSRAALAGSDLGRVTWRAPVVLTGGSTRLVFATAEGTKTSPVPETYLWFAASR